MSEARRLGAGIAAVDITPPVGMPLTGYILREGPSTGIHDPLRATALVLAGAAIKVAIVSCDVLAFDAGFVAETRACIEKATGIPAQHVMLTATHTHSGPATISLRGCGEVDLDWLQLLQERLVGAVRTAAHRLQPAAIGGGSGSIPEGAANRRRPAGPIDRDLEVVRVDDEQGRPMTVLVSVGCHPTALRADNRLISADYPGYAVRALERESGAVAMWFTGAAGDVDPALAGPPTVSPLDATGGTTDQSGFARAERLGRTIAAEALCVLDTIGVSPEVPVEVAQETLDLPLLPAPEAATLRTAAAREQQLLDEALSVGRSAVARVHRAMLGWAQETRQAVEQHSLVQSVPVEIQVIRLGDIALVGVAGELFAELGLGIKAAAKPLQALVSSCTNGDVGYIAGSAEYDLGGYEIEEAFKYYDYRGALAPGSGERVVATATRLLRRIGEV